MPETPPSPAPLFQLATSFWAFKTLAGAYELGLFARLSGTSGLTFQEFAKDVEIDQRPARMLLTGCSSLGLLEKTGDRYRNSPLAEEYLVPGRPHHFGGLLTMLDQRLYPAWGRLTEAVRANRPVSWDTEHEKSLFESQDPAVTATFWEAMHTLSTFAGEALSDAVALDGTARLLDVGGGSGALTIALCRARPGLRATVYDLPFVTPIAARRVDEADLGGRITTVDGNFFEDASLPGGHDAHVFCNILHDWRESDAQLLLNKSFDALAPGGLVIIAGFLVNEEQTGPAPAALMSLTQLIETEGRAYTASEYTGWLTAAGFVEPYTVAMQSIGANGAVVARKP
ncbi:methyltransferase [Streptomyces olivaceus]|uniref:methyltransferase n=1 Tax=Streptomyces olivaceus TaxID=47716 RepID=UPI003818DFC7